MFQNDVSASDREIAPEEVSAWCQEFHVVSFIETSAKTSQNVSTAFIMAVKQWKKFEHNSDLARGGETIDLTRTVNLDGSERTSCCSGNRSASSRPTQHEILQ